VIHLKPVVIHLQGELPQSIPCHIARSVAGEGFSFTEADLFPDDCFNPGDADGSYAPAPNYSYKAAEDELSLRERASSSAASSSATSSSCSSLSSARKSPSDPTQPAHGGDQKRRCVGPSEMRAAAGGAGSLAAQVSLLDKHVEDLTKQLFAEKAERAKAENARDESIAAAHRIAAREFDDLLLSEGGLSRSTLLSSKWHEKHPNAASHVFGFKSWNETKLYLWALFEVKPPKKEDEKGGLGTKARKRQRRKSMSEMSDFERCLLTKMRIHRG